MVGASHMAVLFSCVVHVTRGEGQLLDIMDLQMWLVSVLERALTFVTTLTSTGAHHYILPLINSSTRMEWI